MTRGVIGVSVLPVPLDALAEFGLKERKGALISVVNPGGPAAKGGVEPGDIVLEFNGKPVKNRDDLVSIVIITKPGSTVPVKVLRDKQEKTLNVTIDELDLKQETVRTTPRDTAEPEEQASTGFGITLSAITPDISRRLRLPPNTEGVLVSAVEQGGAAFRAGVLRGDIILQVNRRPVASPQDAGRALSQVPSGNTVFLLVFRNGQEQFLTVRKD